MSDPASPLRLRSEIVVGSVLRGIWGIKTTGLDLIPRSGPLIVACNHVSLWDPPLLVVTIAAARRPRFMGKRELFGIPVLGWFLLQMGSIPLDRGAGDTGAMREALATLQRGACLGIFPEGTRVKPGQRRPPKLGVAFLSARTGAPVVPARVFGTAEFPRAFPLEVRFGSPLAPPAEGREAASSFARSVMDAIYAL